MTTSMHNELAFEQSQRDEYLAGFLPGTLNTNLTFESDWRSLKEEHRRTSTTLYYSRDPPLKWLTAESFHSFWIPSSPGFHETEVHRARCRQPAESLSFVIPHNDTQHSVFRVRVRRCKAYL